jgi:flagellar basal-body rod modification protein FlgD
MSADGSLSQQKDLKKAQTDPQFGDILGGLQAKYGAKAEKPREIKKTLGKDDFLRIMVTQMKNQDPTSPFKPEQMAAEMAQFTSVEQLQNVNQNLQKMATQNNPLERMAMTNMIGKVVTVDRERFPHVEGQGEALNYSLPKDAASVHIAVVSDQGEVILEKDMGPQKTGAQAFAWDGLKSNSLAAKNGTYMLRVDAKDDKGANINIGSQAQARVIGVSFEGNEPVFLVGDARHQDKVTMKNIVKIEEGGGSAGGGQAQAAPSGGLTPLMPSQGTPSFATFEKGKGSSTAPSDVAAALAKAFEAKNTPPPSQTPQAAAPAAPELAEVSKSIGSGDKGFPNGLNEKGGE